MLQSTVSQRVGHELTTEQQIYSAGYTGKLLVVGNHSIKTVSSGSRSDAAHLSHHKNMLLLLTSEVLWLVGGF